MNAGHEVTFTQQGMWVTEQLVGAGTAYHMPLLIGLDGDLDADALLAACAALVERHPMLGQVAAEAEGGLRLVPGADVPVRRLRVTEGVEAAVREEILRGFDLEKGPLARFTLLETGPGRHVLVFVAHHLVFDGHSKDVLAGDLAALYNGEPLTPLESLDHGALERERVAALLPEARDFWKSRWREQGETVLLGRTLRSRRAGEGRELSFTAAPSAVPGLTRFETLLAALHVLLRGYGNDRVTTAVDLSTRPKEAAGHIGLFVNELPVSSEPSVEEDFGSFATALRAGLREVYRFRQVPLVRAMPRIRPHAALVPVSVSYRTRRDADPVFTGLDASVEWTVFNHAVRGALHLQCVDGPGGLTVSLRYDPEVVSDARKVADDLRLLLERATSAPEKPINTLLNDTLEKRWVPSPP
ncbi:MULTISPECIES: condensation domain-containing protein [Streptosporangium]|uniref:Condensation domain-containing protein n=1 Tax=Streptosporangium jomthongense TaxID=1193683 RepID=A0ABV8F1Z6_9ACTN